MAVKKSSGETKGQDESASKVKKKAGGKKVAAKKEAPQTSTAPAPAPAPAPAAKQAAPVTPAAKKAAPTPKKAAAAPIKLSTSQTDLLHKIGGTGDPGYRSEKKGEQRTIDALSERKLIKRGAKHKESGQYHYQISNAGKKHLGATAAAGTPPSGGEGSTPPANPS